MTHRYIPALLTLAATMFLAAHAQAMEVTLPGEPTFDQACDQTVPLLEPLARGRVVAVDKSAGLVTLQFQPILPFLPEGGTRIFAVAHAKWLKGLGPGDKVRFEVERDGRRYTVTRLENSN